MSEPDKSQDVGMSKEEYQKLRASLTGFLKTKMEEIASMKDNPDGHRSAFRDWMQLNERINQVDLEYLQRYMVNVLEGLGKKRGLLDI